MKSRKWKGTEVLDWVCTDEEREADSEDIETQIFL